MPACPLLRHPASPAASVRRIGVRVRRSRGGTLALVYRIEGDLGRLRWPAPRPPRRADQLWRHTCCELFLRERGATGYREFNFAPSTEWAAYRFEAYRDGMAATEPGGRLRIASRARADRIELAVAVDLGPLADADLRVALAAVIEETDGRLSYWALRHPAARPDFHHPDSFALALDRDPRPPVRPSVG